MIRILTQVEVTKREQEIKLDEEGQDFDEKKRINKRKKLIEKGLEPEEADKAIEAEIEWKRLKREGKTSKTKKRKRPQNDTDAKPSTSSAANDTNSD